MSGDKYLVFCAECGKNIEYLVLIGKKKVKEL